MVGVNRREGKSLVSCLCFDYVAEARISVWFLCIRAEVFVFWLRGLHGEYECATSHCLPEWRKIRRTDVGLAGHMTFRMHTEDLQSVIRHSSTRNLSVGSIHSVALL
jgi:hypothetical protein